MINSRLINICLITTVTLSFLLVIFPEIDIFISKLFFHENYGFKYKRTFIIYNIYLILPFLTKIFTLFCLLRIIYIAVKFRVIKYVISSSVFFLFIAAVIGPGLVVNEIFKENFGRARPNQINLFSGTKEFTPAFKITDQCQTNCSFPSGHAAMGYFFSAIAYTRKISHFNKIYISGLLFGSIVGLSRIAMGGHFLSDVIVSAFIVLFLNHIIFILWQKILKNIQK